MDKFIIKIIRHNYLKEIIILILLEIFKKNKYLMEISI